MSKMNVIKAAAVFSYEGRDEYVKQELIQIFGSLEAAYACDDINLYIMEAEANFMDEMMEEDEPDTCSDAYTLALEQANSLLECTGCWKEPQEEGLEDLPF